MIAEGISKLSHILPNQHCNLALQLFLKSTTRNFVAHHGIQRSGTNDLNSCLQSLGIYPLNAFDPARNNPRHKHFRWQEDKSTILPMDERYQNNVTVPNIDRLNRRAGYPEGCRQIVINVDDYTGTFDTVSRAPKDRSARITKKQIRDCLHG